MISAVKSCSDPKRRVFCGAGGQCYDSGRQYICVCEGGWGGLNCDEAIPAGGLPVALPPPLPPPPPPPLPPPPPSCGCAPVRTQPIPLLALVCE